MTVQYNNILLFDDSQSDDESEKELHDDSRDKEIY